MKRAILLIGIIVALGACKDKSYYEYMVNVPIYTSYEDFRQAAVFESPREIQEKGSIYFKSDFLFVVEPEKGVHFINNSNPSAPVKTGFLNVIGATNVAIQDNYMYVNSFIDLIVFDVSSMSNPIEVERLEDVFPMALPEKEALFPGETVDKNKGVVTAWEVEKRKGEEVEVAEAWANCPACNDVNWGGGFTVSLEDGGTSNSSGGAGVAGSISLFTITNNYLYVIQNGSILHPINITNASSPTSAKPVGVINEVETLFPYNGYIFMGTPTGMFIYETTDPDFPKYVSSMSHARGCDPVVVQDDYAYVTVRSGGPCGSATNQLDVIDISDINTPILKNTFEMENPHGLGIDGDALFICDGDAGLKVFNASNPIDCGNHLQYQFENIQATDIIPLGNVAMVIGDDGLYQYDYSDPTAMVLLSKIKF